VPYAGMTYDLATDTKGFTANGVRTHNSFHSGGVASGAGAGSVSTLARLQQLLNMPQTLRDSATLSQAEGKIQSVKPSSAGGVEVTVGGKKHYVPRHLVTPDIKTGGEVKKGDSLSVAHAPTNPHQLLDITGNINKVRAYLVDQLDAAYGKQGVRRRNVETVVRGLTNLTKVKDPGSSEHLHGDVLPLSAVEEHNRNLPKGKRPIEHTPVLHGMSQIPFKASKDWIARLNYRQLPVTIQEGASEGWKSNLHGTHPIPGIAYGVEFGKPPAGKKGPY
jgi:hypothetical protein